MMDVNAIQVRIGELCHQFRLPTMGAQSVARFTAALDPDHLLRDLPVPGTRRGPAYRHRRRGRTAEPTA